jgi:hypothetical protein
MFLCFITLKYIDHVATAVNTRHSFVRFAVLISPETLCIWIENLCSRLLQNLLQTSRSWWQLLFPLHFHFITHYSILNSTEHYATKVYGGSGSIAPCILDLGTRWRWDVSFTPRPLYPQGKSPWYPFDRRLGGPQSRSGRGGEERNSQHLLALEPPIIGDVAQRCTTELSWLFILTFYLILNSCRNLNIVFEYPN